MGNIHLVTGYAGKQHVTSADQGSFNAALVGADQFVFGSGGKLSASIITNNQIRILDGDAYMQGRHIKLNKDTYVDLTIENGAQGYLRNDLIVIRYTKDAATGIEDCNLVVIKGTPAASNPADPAYTVGDIINDNVLLNDMPLYRVPLDGLNVQELVPLFDAKDISLLNHTHTKEDITDFPASMPASDVYAWAKAKNKPTYTASEVGAALAPIISETDITAGSTAPVNGQSYHFIE